MADTTAGLTGKSASTKKKIINTYLTMVSTSKWDKITVKALCEECEINRGTFYKYFDDIFSIVDQLESELLSDLKARYDAIPALPEVSAQKLFENFDANFPSTPHPEYNVWADFCFNHKEPLMALCHPENGEPYFVKKMHNLVIDRIDIMMSRDGFPKDNYRDFFRHLMFETHMTVIMHWFSSGNQNLFTREMIPVILNTTRIGACYDHYKLKAKPEN